MGSQLPPCRHRGALAGFRLWECHSPKVATEAGVVSENDCCRFCPHVDHAIGSGSDGPIIRALPSRRVVIAGEMASRHMAIGIISAPRQKPTIATMLLSLRRAGFRQVVDVFAEPGTTVPELPGTRLHRNTERLGLWRNWQNAALTLLLETDAEFLLLCEDDVRFAPCAAAALQSAIDHLERGSWGYASLYTPRHNVRGGIIPVEGWEPLAAGPALWGALAYCFTRKSLTRLLTTGRTWAWRGNDGTDAIVSQGMCDLSLKCYFHFPSLGEHLGEGNSSVGHVSLPDHRAVGFIPTYRGYEFSNSPEGARTGPPSVRVGFLTPPLLMGGAENWILSLLKHLDRRSIEPSGVAMLSNGAGTRVDLDMCRRAADLAPLVGDQKHECFRSAHGIANATGFSSEWDAVQWLCDRSDLLIAWGLPLLRSWLASWRFAGQIVCVAHGTGESAARELARWHQPGVHFAAVSRSAASSFLGRPAVTIANGGDTARCLVTISREQTRAAWGIGPAQKAIGFVGRFSWEKNPLAIADAVRALGPGFRAVYIGQAHFPNDIERQVRELVPDAVFVPGMQQIGNALHALDVFMLASPAEGSSLSLTEAWLCGTPAVATRVGAVPELEESHGPLVVSVPVNPSPSELATAVRQALSDDNRPRIDRARSVAWQHLTDRRMGERWTAYLMSLLPAVPPACGDDPVTTTFPPSEAG